MRSRARETGRPIATVRAAAAMDDIPRLLYEIAHFQDGVWLDFVMHMDPSDGRFGRQEDLHRRLERVGRSG